MKRIALALSVACLLGLLLVQPAIAAVANQPCVECHAAAGSAPGAVVDFGVTVDYAKCNSCHWYAEHDFDDFHVAQAAAPDYLSQQCSSCHHSQATFPTRTTFTGFASSLTPYGFFQTATSPLAAAETVHGVHVNGSWLRGVSGCDSCHGVAACDACHTTPAPTHAGHGNLGVRDLLWSSRIGSLYGDACSDTYLYQRNPATNYDAATAMYIGRTSSGEERAIIRFPLAKLSGSNVTTVTLNLTSARAGSFPIRAYRLRRSDWVSSQVTWNSYKSGAAWTQAGAGGAADHDQAMYADSTTGVFDVSALVKAAVARGDAYLDLLLLDPVPVSGRYAGFYSAQTVNAPWRPYLEVTGTKQLQLYGYGPVAGTQPGSTLPSYVTADRSCTAEACHRPAAAASAEFTPACGSCHPDRETAHGYEPSVHLAEATVTELEMGGRVYQVSCSECHGMELGPEHQKPASSSGDDGCGACHPTPRDSFAEWDGSCAQGGCHTATSSAPLHAGAEQAHVRPGNSDACFEAGCHADADAAAIHAGVGCAVCHGPGVTPSVDCATCHAEEGVDYHSQMAEKHLSPTTTTCFGVGCHDATRSLPAVHALYAGPGSEFPQYGSACALCHGNEDPDRIDWGVAGAGCTGTCHSGTTHSRYSVRHTLTTASDTCADCHGSNLSAIHGAESDLSKCATCHADPANWSKTADCSSCHESHPVDAAFCTGCHNTANGTYAGASTFSATRHAGTNASALAATVYPGSGAQAGACANCHGTHGTTRAAGNELCFGCHDAAGTTKAGTYSYQGRTRYASSAHGVSSGAQACGTCHAVHGATGSNGALVGSGLKRSDPESCAGTVTQPGCHAQPVNSANGRNILAAFSAGTASSTHHDVYSSAAGAIDCSSCHDPHTDTSTRPYGNPRAIGTELADATDRFRDANGRVYALVGAQHDAVGPVITSYYFYGNASTPQTRSTYWYTDEPATGYFDYGPTATYGSTVVTNSYLSTYHGTSGLTFPVGTTWHYRFRQTDALGNTSYSPDYTYRVPWTHLTKAAAVTGGAAGAPVTVTWTTLGACDSWVDFGPTTAYGSTQGSSTQTTTHSVTLSGLAPALYHLRARSARDGDTYTSGDMTVLVSPAYATAPVLTPVPSNSDIGGPQLITFSWSQPNVTYAPFTYQVRIWDPYSSPAYDYTSPWLTTNTFQLTLDGDHNYQWTVQAKDVNGTVYPLQSPPGSFYLFYYSGGSGSCPFLYTWDGDSYVFESDEFAAGKLGLNTKAGFRKPNPLDYHVLATDPVAKDGALEYKLVEERAETDYLDQVKLYTVDAPEDKDIYIERSQAEGVGRFTSLNAVIHTTEKNLRPPKSVTWVNTGQDVTSKVAASDEEYVMLNEDRNVGYDYQTLELDLGEVQNAPQTKLVIDGRTCIPTTIAGRQRSLLFGPQVKFEVQDATGKWVAVPTTNTILPKPPEFKRPFVLDLSRIWISDSRKVRFTYLYKTYFDAILLDTSADVPVAIRETPLISADLQPHGFDDKSSLGELYEYVYDDVVSPPTYYLPGYYTKFGAVDPLLQSIDDKFVIFGGGDELTLRFDVPEPPAQAITRRFLFLSDGYYKDLKQTIDHTVEPLPFAAMSNFPYAATEHYPDDADHTAYREQWNTRYQEKASTLPTGAVTPQAVPTETSGLLDTVGELLATAVDNIADFFTPNERVMVASAEPAETSFSVDTDRIGLKVLYPSTSAALAPSAGWQSAAAAGSMPAPSAPGSPVSSTLIGQASSTDSVYWRTDLTSTDRAYNWQLVQFNVSDAVLNGATGFRIEWRGHGEPSPGYPVKLYLWDFTTSSWALASQGAGGTDFDLSRTERQASTQTFCLSCHQSEPPAGASGAASYVNLLAAWETDAHGERAGGGFGGSLKLPYSRGANSLACETCHDSHGSANSYHLKSTINGRSGITVTSGVQYQNACVACHDGTVSAWHDQCTYCHQVDIDHTWGPAIDGTWNCASCHQHGKVWAHPDEGCHGCGDPAGMAWRTF